MGTKISLWMKRVLETQDQEILCSECLDQVSRYVDLEFSAGEAHSQMPGIEHHLDQCQVCREEYEILRDLARLEASGDLPPSHDLKDSLS